MKVTENKDLFGQCDTLDAWEQLCRQHWKERIQNNPFEVVKELRKKNLITDEECKKMIINIRILELEGDFENEQD